MAFFKGHAQESKNQRVAGPRESLRLVRCGVRCFRRPGQGCSFPTGCPGRRSAENTFLSRLTGRSDEREPRPSRRIAVGSPSRADPPLLPSHCQITGRRRRPNDAWFWRTGWAVLWDPPGFRKARESDCCRYFNTLVIDRHLDREGFTRRPKIYADCRRRGGV
jgi:hypothetical protein